MDSYRDSTLVFRLVSEGLRGNGLAGPALHGMRPERTGSAKPPAKFQGGQESVNTDRGEPVGVNYGTNIDAAMANAMSRGRVYRARPLLIALDGGLSGAHG